MTRTGGWRWAAGTSSAGSRRTFNAMLSALQRSLAAQRRLVSDASHELRTPLASLRLNVDVLTENPDLPAAERQEVLARVTDQVAELSRLVASVTDLARGEPPAATMVSRPAQRGRRRSPRRGAARLAEDGVRRAPGGGVIEGSADRLRVAFKNLLDNAAKFGPPEGPVQVRLSGGELTVRDHGPGIADEDLPFIFDRFYRALSSRSAPGSGLGLAVVREIVVRPRRHDRRRAGPGRRHRHAANPSRSRPGRMSRGAG